MRWNTLHATTLPRLTILQEHASNKAVPHPADVGAYDLTALLAFREPEERRGYVLVFVDDSIILLQLKECGLKVMNDFHSRGTHQARQGSVRIFLGDLTLFNLERDEMMR
jgi:hypothetical protein